MIVKIIPHKTKSFQELLEYMTEDYKRLFNAEGKSFTVTHNLKGRTIGRWVEQFFENESYRRIHRPNSTVLTHEILSWDQRDAKALTLEKLQDITREYIRMRDPAGLYVCLPHFDKGHMHVHICASGLKFHSGKSLRLTKKEFQSLKKDIQNYQLLKYPEISHSTVSYDKKEKMRTTEKEYQYKLRTGRQTDKEKVITLLEGCYTQAFSMDDFLGLLKDSGATPYIRSGKTTGIVFNGRKYRFNRHGITQERIEALGKSIERGKDLEGIKKRKTKNLSRNI